MKSSPEIVRSSLLPFFTFAADDLTHTVANLKIGRFSHVKGTITRGADYDADVFVLVLVLVIDERGSFSAIDAHIFPCLAQTVLEDVD